MSGLLGFVVLLPVLLLSMVAHEVAHGAVAHRLGDPTAKEHGRLTANPLKHLDPLGTLMFAITYFAGGFIFGWAKPVPVNARYFRDHQKGMMLVGLAGPFTNFLIAIVIGRHLEPDRAGCLELGGAEGRVDTVPGSVHRLPGERRPRHLQPGPHPAARWIEGDRRIHAPGNIRPLGRPRPLRHAFHPARVLRIPAALLQPAQRRFSFGEQGLASRVRLLSGTAGDRRHPAARRQGPPT